MARNAFVPPCARKAVKLDIDRDSNGGSDGAP